MENTIDLVDVKGFHRKTKNDGSEKCTTRKLDPNRREGKSGRLGKNFYVEFVVEYDL